jgi:hypothetical protein
MVKSGEVDESALAVTVDRFTADIHAHRAFAQFVSTIPQNEGIGDANAIIKRMLQEFGQGSSRKHINEIGRFVSALSKAVDLAGNDPGTMAVATFQTSERTARLIGTRVIEEMSRAAAEKTHAEVLRRLCLSGAVASFEILLGKVVRLFYRRANRSLEGRQVSYAEILQFDSLDALRESVLDSAVDDVMRQSVEGWYKFINEKLHIDLAKNEIPWNDVSLIINHRHVIVHAESIANPRLVEQAKTSEALGALLTPIQGKLLLTSHPYLSRALDRLEIAGVLLALVGWSHMDKDGKHPYYSIIDRKLSAAMHRESWEVASALATWGSRMKRFSTAHQNRLMFDAWLSRIRHDDRSARAELEAFDPSALRPDLSACYFALRGNVQALIGALRKIDKSEQLDFLSGPYCRKLEQDDKLQEYRRKVSATMRNNRKGASSRKKRETRHNDSSVRSAEPPVEK